ncbi:MAG TPA: helix-turn-helix domain-containing protein [Methylovirgula sp.]|nr:helix-turn-helix domain-containing protein [Methylovirgula sp.]
MELHEKIRAARERHGLSQAALAQAVGVSQPAIKKIESGETKRSRYLSDIMKYLGLEEEDRPVARPESGVVDFPIFAAAEGGPGEMVVSTDPIDIVARPWYLHNVKQGYGVVIVGESMIPKFEPGDIVIVNPRLPVLRNRPAIFVSGRERGEFTATIKMLVRETPAEWHVMQFNPPAGGKREYALSKKIWTKALRVVGTYEAG